MRCAGLGLRVAWSSTGTSTSAPCTSVLPRHVWAVGTWKRGPVGDHWSHRQDNGSSPGRVRQNRRDCRRGASRRSGGATPASGAPRRREIRSATGLVVVRRPGQGAAGCLAWCPLLGSGGRRRKAESLRPSPIPGPPYRPDQSQVIGHGRSRRRLHVLASRRHRGLWGAFPGPPGSTGHRSPEPQRIAQGPRGST
jgi:hypothetical protein